MCRGGCKCSRCSVCLTLAWWCRSAGTSLVGAAGVCRSVTGACTHASTGPNATSHAFRCVYKASLVTRHPLHSCPTRTCAVRVPRAQPTCPSQRVSQPAACARVCTQGHLRGASSFTSKRKLCTRLGACHCGSVYTVQGKSQKKIKFKDFGLVDSRIQQK